MKKISKILVPYDYSSSANCALEYAVNFVGNRDIDIHILHISDDVNIEKMYGAYGTLSNKYKDQLKQTFKWNWGCGNITETIIEVQKDKNVELIIMGTSGITKDRRETNTSILVKEIDSAVMVIPSETDKVDIEQICLVLDEFEIDNPVSLEILLEISRSFNAKVHVVTIKNTNKIYGYSKTEEKNENTISYYLENFYHDHTFIKNDDIVEGIFSYAKKHKIDMIAVLPRNHAKHTSPSEGLLTKELVVRANVPVLVME